MSVPITLAVSSDVIERDIAKEEAQEKEILDILRSPFFNTKENVSEQDIDTFLEAIRSIGLERLMDSACNIGVKDYQGHRENAKKILQVLGKKTTKPPTSTECIPPTKDEIAFSFMRKQQETFWYDYAIDFREDRSDFATMKDKYPKFEKFVKKTFSVLVPLDNPVIDNNSKRLLDLCKTPEQYGMVIFMIAIEQIHKNTYERIVHISPWTDIEKAEILAMCKSKDCYNEFSEFTDTVIRDGTDSDVILFNCCYEGIFALDLVTNTFLFNKFNLFHMIISANHSIYMDESLHAEEDCHLAKVVGYTTEQAHNMIKRFVAYCYRIQREYFFEDSEIMTFPDNDVITLQERFAAIRYNADLLCSGLNIPELYGDGKPLKCTVELDLSRKNNFFERRKGGYQSVSGVNHDALSATPVYSI